MASATDVEVPTWFRAVACLLPIISGGGIPFFGLVNPFWQIVFGSGGWLAELILPAHGRGSAWDLFGIAIFPWMVIAVLHVAAGKVWRMPAAQRLLCVGAYLSSFLVITPVDTLLHRWPGVARLPFYLGLFD